MDVRGYQFIGPRGNELKAKLEKIEPTDDETKNRFLQAVDKDENHKISNEEAGKALDALKQYNVGNIKVLTEYEVDQISDALKINSDSENISGLEALGVVYYVPGTNFQAVLLEKDAVENFTGKKLEEIFANCPKNKEYETRGGFIVDVDLHQQVALLKAINDKNPKLKIGMFNYRASENVQKVLKAAKIDRKFKVDWFWTGEKSPGYLDEKKYVKPGLVFENELKDIDGRYFGREIHYGSGYFLIDDKDRAGVVVFGALRK